MTRAHTSSPLQATGQQAQTGFSSPDNNLLQTLQGTEVGAEPHLEDSLQEDGQDGLQGFGEAEARYPDGRGAPLPALLLLGSADGLLQGAHIGGHHLLGNAACHRHQCLPAQHQHLLATVVCHQHYQALHMCAAAVRTAEASILLNTLWFCTLSYTFNVWDL